MPDTLTFTLNGRLREWVLLKPERFEQLLAYQRTSWQAQKVLKGLPARTLAEIRDAAIINALVCCRGNRAQAAKTLNVPERTFYRHIKRLEKKELKNG